MYLRNENFIPHLHCSFVHINFYHNLETEQNIFKHKGKINLAFLLHQRVSKQQKILIQIQALKLNHTSQGKMICNNESHTRDMKVPLSNETNSVTVWGQCDLMKSAFESKFLFHCCLSIAGILANKLLEEMNIINQKGIISPPLMQLHFVEVLWRL